jgi:hypothetical protein
MKRGASFTPLDRAGDASARHATSLLANPRLALPRPAATRLNSPDLASPAFPCRAECSTFLEGSNE